MCRSIIVSVYMTPCVGSRESNNICGTLVKLSLDCREESNANKLASPHVPNIYPSEMVTPQRWSLVLSLLLEQELKLPASIYDGFHHYISCSPCGRIAHMQPFPVDSSILPGAGQGAGSKDMHPHVPVDLDHQFPTPV